MLPTLGLTAPENRRGGTSPAQRDTSCSQGDAEEAPSLLQQPPEAGNGKGNAKSSRKQQKGARLSTAEHNKSPAPAPHSCPDATPR